MANKATENALKVRENRKKSLLGQKFGKLTVLERQGINARNYANYLCKCECGNTIVADSQKLRRGAIQSCGCVPGNHSNLVDLTGQRFGRLTVIEITDQRNYKGSVMWRVRCDCGTEKIYSEDSLKHGKIQSCGCYRREEAARRMHNRVFNYDASHSRKVRDSAKSGEVGVYVLSSGKYRPYITMMGKRKYLGTYVKLEDAVAARRKAEQERWQLIKEQRELLGIDSLHDENAEK